MIRYLILAGWLWMLGCSCGQNTHPRPDVQEDAYDIAGDPDADASECAPGTPAGNGPTTAYRSIELRPEGFIVDGAWKTLRGGTVQWFRLPKGEWRDRLRKFAGAFNTVDVYVPWNVVEPKPGEFDFGDLLAFLELCKEFGLYVYFRPGPYICNEMNGGGIPSWLVPYASKKALDSDGLINFRTKDPDFLQHVRNYFHHLNQAVGPYLITRGGPILLYAVENEYNWFEIFAGVDKLAWYEGGTERPVGQDIGTTEYLAALRDFVRSDGIDIPVTTCPGDSKISGMGDVYGIVPMPNFYISGGTEKLAYDVVTGMHDPDRYDGRFTGYPSGTTESERRATRMVRTFFGGMDAYFAFNAAGMHTPDRHNALVLNNAGLFSMVDTSPDRVVQAFVSPMVGYFHNVVDYYGPIDPAGGLREKYYAFRARHLFFESMDGWFAPLLHPLRSGNFSGADPRMAVNHPDVGAQEGNTRVHYWFLSPEGTWFAQLLNETTHPVQLPPGSVQIDGVQFPRYTTLTLPVSSYPGAAGGENGLNAADSPEELHYAHIAEGRLPLLEQVQLLYTTGEILTWRTFNGEKLLVLTAPLGAEGEAVFTGAPDSPQLVYAAPGVVRHESAPDELAVSWVAQKTPQTLRLQTVSGESLRVWLLSTEDAGRYWFFRAAFQDAAVGPLEDLELLDDDACRLQARASVAPETRDLYLFSGSPIATGREEGAFHADAGMQVLRVPDPGPQPELPELEAAVRPDPGPQPDAWVPAGDSAVVLETVGVHTGPAWVRARVDLPANPAGGKLYVDHASDIVGIFINGNYITTVCPVGTEIDNQSLNANYRFPDVRPYLQPGVNEILFRVEIWGHGSFMWPRGRIIATSAQLPSLGFDSFKGLWGRAQLAGRDLVQWEVHPGSGGENLQWHQGNADGFARTELPTVLSRGQTLWVRASFPTAGVTPQNPWQAPVALRLEGKNLVGTLWLNGHLIGRWLSDSDFLQRGAWNRALRDMWMNTSPDEFPLAASLLHTDGLDNVIVLQLDDVSGPSDTTGGQLDAFRLVRFAGEKSVDSQGTTTRAPRWTCAWPLTFSFSGESKKK